MLRDLAMCILSPYPRCPRTLGRSLRRVKPGSKPWAGGARSTRTCQSRGECALLNFAAPLADRLHARSRGCSAAARGRPGGVVVFGSEYIDCRETRLPCDAVPEVDCKADVARPKGIPSTADDCLRAAILD